MKTASKYLICFDFETGGLPSKDKKAFYDIALVETAMVVIDMEALEICEEVSMIFQPDYKENLLPIDPMALATHGITRDIQESKGVPLKEIFKKWLELFKKYKNPKQMCTLVGHNVVGFDVPFLRNFFEFMGDNLDNYVKFCLDTMQIAHMSALEQENYKLNTCCTINNIDLVNAHRALDDTKANAYLMIEYVKRLRGQGQQNRENSNVKKSTFREMFAI